MKDSGLLELTRLIEIKRGCHSFPPTSPSSLDFCLRVLTISYIELTSYKHTCIISINYSLI